MLKLTLRILKNQNIQSLVNSLKLANDRLAAVIKFTILALAVLGLVACTVDNTALKARFREVRARKGRPIEPIPEFKPMPKFTYPSHLKRRNPFYSYNTPQIVKKSTKKKSDLNAPNLKRRRQALEKFKLKDLVIVGTLRRNGVVWGLVSAPDDVIHKVTVGSYLGRDHGRVISITDKKIRLIETYNENKEWKKRDVNLRIDKDRKALIKPKDIHVEEIQS